MVGGIEQITVNEAGRRGGLAVLRKRGRTFYVEIGSKGQAVMRRKYPDKAREWGKLGGRPKKLVLESVGEAALSNERRHRTRPE